MDCIFCKIVAGEIPAAKIYEDESVLAFLDIHPVNPGHALIIPKEHHQWMAETPDELVTQVMLVAKQLMGRIKTALGADYVGLSVVGVDVPHFHVHVIPRYHDDGMAGFWPTKEYGQGEMEEVVEKIRKNE